ncbi:MAG: HAD family hydrolase [Candidatus Levybacteria bacterium]|nr:HAD family hydrolase [Candidatus Levybacteria bacterium]
MIKLVIIDFDDTLSLTEEAFFKIENHIAEKLGFAPMTREAHQKNWGRPVKKAILERIPGIDADKFMQMHKEVLPGFVEKGEVDAISDKNIEVLKKLKSDGKRLAILTSRSFHEAEHLLDENHHLNKFIEKIYHADNSKYLKPDPRAFDLAIQDFNVKPEETIYIGDSVSDGISAKGAEIHFIALLESGLRTKEDFKSIPVDYFAKTFHQILSYIEKN